MFQLLQEFFLPSTLVPCWTLRFWDMSVGRWPWFEKNIMIPRMLTRKWILLNRVQYSWAILFHQNPSPELSQYYLGRIPFLLIYRLELRFWCEKPTSVQKFVQKSKLGQQKSMKSCLLIQDVQYYFLPLWIPCWKLTYPIPFGTCDFPLPQVGYVIVPWRVPPTLLTKKNRNMMY